MAEQKIHITISEDDEEFSNACKWFDVIKLTKQQKNEIFRSAIVEYLNSMQGMEHMRSLALQKKSTPQKKPPVKAPKKEGKAKSSLKPLTLNKNSESKTNKSSADTEQITETIKPYTGFDNSLADNKDFMSLLENLN